jgi:hypothetical protein
MSSYGVDSVSAIDDVIASIKSYFSHTPAFFCRYVDPCPFEGLEQDSSTEASSAHNNGVSYILPVTSPSSVTGTTQTGTADGNTVCGNIRSAINNAADHLALPTNQILDVYLDIEGTVGQNYWEGWAVAVNKYYDSVPQGYPYYTSAYTNAQSGNCSVLCTFGDWLYADSVWADVPQEDTGCANCGWAHQGWGSQNHCTCSSYTLYTVVWQYVQGPTTGYCYTTCDGSYPDVDLDITTPGQNQLSYMLRTQ